MEKIYSRKTKKDPRLSEVSKKSSLKKKDRLGAAPARLSKGKRKKRT
jgi:hypothetical protein